MASARRQNRKLLGLGLWDLGPQSLRPSGPQFPHQYTEGGVQWLPLSLTAGMMSPFTEEETGARAGGADGPKLLS